MLDQVEVLALRDEAAFVLERRFTDPDLGPTSKSDLPISSIRR
jgi:hypothetical protein